MCILDKKNSPGTRVERFYLGHQQIIQHIDKPICYSQEEVDLAKKEKGILTKKTGDQIITDSVIDLLTLNDNHIIYKLESLSKYKSHWLELGCALLSYTEEEVIELSSALGDGAKMVDKLPHNRDMDTTTMENSYTRHISESLLNCGKANRSAES